MDIFIRGKAFMLIIFFSLTVMLFFCSCRTVPIEQQMKMRSELQDRKSYENIDSLLNMLCDDTPVDSAVYNYAIETIVYLANKKQLYKTNPELFSKIRKTFLEISKDESFEDGEDQKYAQKTKRFLKMYSIYALLQLEPQNITSFRTYLEVLNDFSYPAVCQLPALAGLRKTAKLYSNNPDEVVEVILSVTGAESKLLKSKPYNFRESAKAQKWFLQKYTSLEMFNSFWKTRVYELGDDKVILRMLKLNYDFWQFLMTQERQADLKKLKNNINLIIIFLEAKGDSFPKVDSFARKFLLSIIPQRYYLFLLNKLKDYPQQYFSLLAMSQWLYKDRAEIQKGAWCYEASDGEKYFNCNRLFGKDYLTRCKNETSKITVFLLKNKINNYSLKQKEVFYKQIAKFYPSLLALHLIRDFKEAHKFSSKLSQDIRFSWHLLQFKRLNEDCRNKLLKSSLHLLAQFSKSNDLKQLVSLINAYYLKTYPEEIIKNIDTIMKNPVNVSNIYSLMTLYIRSLEQLYKKSHKNFKTCMFECRKTFLSTIKRRHSLTNKIIYQFLSQHDPVFLVSAIAQSHFNDKNTSEIRTDFKLLGTQAVKYRKELEKKDAFSQAVRAKVLSILSSNIALHDDTISLLSASYLLRLSNENDTAYAGYLQKITVRWPQIEFNYIQKKNLKSEDK